MIIIFYRRRYTSCLDNDNKDEDEDEDDDDDATVSFIVGQPVRFSKRRQSSADDDVYH